LAKTAPDLDDKIRFVPPIFLDYLAVQLGDWSGYHLLASYRFGVYLVNSLGWLRV